MRERDPEFERWIQRAKDTPISALLRHPKMPKLKGRSKLKGPCPVCGGQEKKSSDRFSINTDKGLWHCRKCGTGGDAIALVRHIEGCDFITACEHLTREKPPGGKRREETAEERERRERELRAWREEVAAREARKAEDEAKYREAERQRCWDFWRHARPIAGTPVEQYLALRRIFAPPGAHLRYAADHKLWASGGSKPELVHRGPAMLAAILGPDGRFAGLHATWIDLSQEDGKARVPDPEDGEFVPAKKVRGSSKGGRIELVRVANPARMMLGEGIETVLSVWCALIEIRSLLVEGTAFWSSIDLRNLGGNAVESVLHPTERHVDRRGRSVPKRVPGPDPDWDSPVVPVPDSVTELIYLGDGDSDPFFTELTLQRAARRHARPGRGIRVAWAKEGLDFNDLRRGMAA